MTTEPLLNSRQRQTLAAAADTLVPGAATLGVPAALEAGIGQLAAGQQREIGQLLSLMEQPLVMAALAGRRLGFSSLQPAERERALLRMARGPVGLLRTGFQALKRLTSFLAYAVTPADGPNPLWQEIGYSPAGSPPAIGAALRLTAIVGPVTLDADVCVVGSGAGGGVAAAELARAGRRVVVLEAGGGWQAPGFDQRELPGMERLYLDRGTTATRDLSIAILAGGALGGGTTVNWQTSLRTPEGVRAEWAERSGCRHFTEDSFSRSLDAVCERLAVGTAESAVNANNEVLRRGCETLGFQHETIARNSRGCDAAQCGYCVYGCRHGGKQTTSVTYLRDAQQAGEARIVASCRAERIRLAAGRVSGVLATATGEDGRRHAVDVRAPIVVVAAGSIESPVLLLRSGLTLPALGRHLHLHPTTAVAGEYEEPIEPWRGPPQTVLSGEFASLDGGYGFRLETAPVHPGLLAIALPWHGAADHARCMRRAAHTAAFIVLTRDRSSGRVRADRDGRALIDYRPGARELAHLRRGMVEASRVHLAAGAREVTTLHGREQRCRSAGDLDAFAGRIARAPFGHNYGGLFSAHQMGTCRMGSSAREAVCDENGQVFGARGLFVADASAFPGSSGVNPMITIMALAHHTAGRLLAGTF